MTDGNLFLDDEDDTSAEESSNKADAAFAKQRKQIDRLEKELAELRAFKAERDKTDRETSIGGMFTQVGLNPKHARLYAALNPEGDATPEQVAAFAAEFGLVTAEGEQPATPTPEPGFTPAVIGGQPLSAGVLSAADWRQVALTDPTRAQRLLAEGRVDMAGLRTGLGPER